MACLKGVGWASSAFRAATPSIQAVTTQFHEHIQHSTGEALPGIADRHRKEGPVLNRNTWRAIAAFAAGVLLLSACGGGEVPPSAFPGLLVDGTSAYLASNIHLFKFDAQTGIEKWRYPATVDNANPRGPFSGVPLKYGDAIVVGSIGEPSTLIPLLASDSASHDVAGLVRYAIQTGLVHDE